MYTAQGAIGVRLGLNKRWETIDLTAWTVAQLFLTFRRVQVQVQVDNTPGSSYFDLSEVAATYATFAGTVAQMLTNLGNVTLAMSSTPLVLNNRKAAYMDAFLAGYSVTPVTAVNTLDPNMDPLQLPCVRLTNSQKQINYTYFFNNCLVNVNGFFHLIDTDGINGVMVKDAMKCLVKSGQNQIGLWSFTDVGGFTLVPITPQMVDTSVSTRATLTIPGNWTQCTPMLVLGGYLVLLDNVAFSQTGTNSYTIDFSQLSLVDRYFESNNYLDLSSLGLETSSNNSAQIALPDLITPQAISAWLALSQSFVVMVNSPELYSQKLGVKSSGFPHLYTTFQQPTSPLVLELGRMPPYWPTEEDQQYSLSIYDNVIGNKMFYTVPTPSWLSSSGADMPGMPGHLSSAYLLEIGRDV